jgi:hypothetical protein
MYESVPKSLLLAEPHRFAWNIVVREHQFTQEELLAVREYLDLPTLIRFQRCLTLDFLRTHFTKDIDDCLEVDWTDVKNAGIQ